MFASSIFSLAFLIYIFEATNVPPKYITLDISQKFIYIVFLLSLNSKYFLISNKTFF